MRIARMRLLTKMPSFTNAWLRELTVAARRARLAPSMPSTFPGKASRPQRSAAPGKGGAPLRHLRPPACARIATGAPEPPGDRASRFCAHRLAVQDVALSRRKHGFESRVGRAKEIKSLGRDPRADPSRGPAGHPDVANRGGPMASPPRRPTRSICSGRTRRTRCGSWGGARGRMAVSPRKWRDGRFFLGRAGPGVKPH